MIDLRPDHLEIVRDLLRQHLPECEVRAFGSRFKWTAKQASDLDLAVVGTKRLPTKKIMRLKEAFEESILPMRVDVLDWHAITPEFQRVIDAGFEVIQGGEVSPLAPASSPSAAGSFATPLDKSFRAHWLTAGGIIPDGWEFVSIESLLETSKSMSVGVMYPGNHTPNGIPLVKVSDVSDGVISKTPEFCVSEDVHEEYKRTALNGSELLITLVGNPGDCVIASPRMAGWNVARALAVMRFKDPEIRTWVRFSLISEPAKHFIDSRLNTTVQKTLNLKDLKELGIPLPPRKIRDAISSILGTLDERIQLYRRTNETLESIARALFKDWFIDFGPVRTNMEGDRLLSISPEISKLFPGQFVDSEFGEIPERWETALISEICCLGRGASPRPINDYMGEDVPWIKIADATNANGPFLFETKERIKLAGVEKSVEVFPGDLILSNSATCGLPIFVEVYGCIHDGWLYFKDLKRISKEYFYQSLICLADRLVQIADGSVQKNLNTKLVGQQRILIPTRSIMDAFDSQISPLYKRIRSIEREAHSLMKLRDSLLPKLLSGELSIPDALLMVEQTP